MIEIKAAGLRQEERDQLSTFARTRCRLERKGCYVLQPKEKEQKVYEVFQSISPTYDTMNSIISFRLHKWWRKATMRKMQVFPGAKCLDVCCGTADWTIQLAEAAGNTGVVKGLDFSENMLKVGHEKVVDYPSIELIHGNAMTLPFGDHSFDYVTIGFGLRNVPELHDRVT